MSNPDSSYPTPAEVSRIFDLQRKSFSTAKIEEVRLEKGISKEAVAKAIGLADNEHAYNSYILNAPELDSGLLPGISKVAVLLGVDQNQLKG